MAVQDVIHRFVPVCIRVGRWHIEYVHYELLVTDIDLSLWVKLALTEIPLHISPGAKPPARSMVNRRSPMSTPPVDQYPRSFLGVRHVLLSNLLFLGWPRRPTILLRGCRGTECLTLFSCSPLEVITPFFLFFHSR